MSVSNILHTQFTVGDFLTWQKSSVLILSPSFQRRAMWPSGAKSFLIDSLIRGLPIPPISLREMPPDLKTLSTSREVVDGQQRIRSVLSFVAPDCLGDFDKSRDEFKIRRVHNQEYGGCAFSQLPSQVRSGILNYQFVAHVFPSDTDDRDILEIFARMNATGYKLNNQELRNAKYFGEFKTLAFSLAAEQLNRWREWKVFSEANIARMFEVEMTSDLMTLIVKGVSEKDKKTLDLMYARHDESFETADVVARRFRTVMDKIEDDFSSKLPAVLKSTPLFYCLFAAVYDRLFGLGSALTRKKATPISQIVVASMVAAATKLADGSAPPSVQKLTERRTSHVQERKKLTNYISRGSK